MVAVDAPCSGEGMFRKDPGAREEWSEGNVRLCAARQDAILREAWRALKPGGRLIYSTCTIHQGENQENVRWFLANYPFIAVDITDRFVPELREPSMKEGWVQFLPGKHGCDGFFVAVFQRKAKRK